MPHSLASLISPESIAVFGASERKNALGNVIFRNILEQGFQGPVFPINPKYQEVLGQRCFTALRDIETPIQLAIIATPAETVAGIFKQCGEHGVKAAIVLSGGFRESGQRGEQLEQEVIRIARHYGIRFIGPNCFGIVRPPLKLNATFTNGLVASGNLALISQSGAICSSVMDWADSHDVGFSAVVSIGISIDIDFGEILDFLVTDPKTHSILLYMEGIRNARSFMSGLRAAARVKPVIVVKAGRHEASMAATMSHTGARSGNDDVFAAALRRAGVVRGMHIGDLFAAATVLSRRVKLKGENLAMITNGGGPAAMACDRACDLNIPLARLQPATLARLSEFLPPMWSRMNPVDILGDADGECYEKALAAVLDDTHVHGVLVMLTPQASTDAEDIARRIIQLALSHSKPVLACWMGDRQVRDGRKLLADAGIPSFRLPENAIQAFSYLSNFYHNQKLLLETPGPLTHSDKPDLNSANFVIQKVLDEHRHLLSGAEARAVLAAFQIPITPSIEARTAIDAVVAAASIGFPVAMKVHGRNLPLTVIESGSRLNISSSAAIQAIFTELTELFAEQYPEHTIDGVVIEPMIATQHGQMLSLGITQDAIFGPVITLGTGGETSTERAVALPPLNRVLARDLIARTPFAGLHNNSLTALENVLIRVSEIACEQPQVQDLNINPLVVEGSRVTAVDTTIHVSEYVGTGRNYEHTAIHPYPSHLMQDVKLQDGTPCTIRPIRPEDAEIERAFVEGLSDAAKRYRFMNIFREIPRDMLARFTQIDYDREMAFIAVIQNGAREQEIGVVRYTIGLESDSCEFAITITDTWQGKGVAPFLMEALISYARTRGLTSMIGEVLSDNRRMLRFVQKLGFETHICPDDPSITLIKKML